MSAAGTTRPALGPGLVVPKRRAFFGLLDADGWSWAGLKAFVWLVIIILMLGYIPDRAYYFTVNRTLQLGLLVWSPINFCSNENETLPCPAPLGALVPWHESPTELALPQARTDGTGGPARDEDPVHRRDGRHDGAVDACTSPRHPAPATSTSGPTGRRSPSRAATQR